MSRAALWAFKARVLTRPRSVYETPSVFERKQRPDKSHGALNQWPVLRRHNCLFTASSKSILAFPSPIHPYRYGADSGCLAAAVLELFLFVFSCFCDWSATKSAPSLSFFFLSVLDADWLQWWKTPEKWMMSSTWEARGERKMVKLWILYAAVSKVCVHVCTHRKPSACIQPGCRSSSRILRWAGRWWWWPTGSWRPAEHSLRSRAPRWSGGRQMQFKFTESGTSTALIDREQLLHLWKPHQDNHLRKCNGSTASQ